MRHPITTRSTTSHSPKKIMRHTTTAHDSPLRASQLTNVSSEELQWFFTSYEDGPAARLARSTIAEWLGSLDPTDRHTLSLRFDVAPWAEDLHDAGLQSGFALAVHLACAKAWHPKSSPRDRSHREASQRLEATVRERGASAVRDISRRADWAFARAVRAYAAARGRAPSALPGRAA